MYIAGLNLPISNAQGKCSLEHLSTLAKAQGTVGAEALAVASTFGSFVLMVREQMRLAKLAAASAGPIQTPSRPLPLAGKLATPIHALAMWLPPISFMLGTTINGFTQPNWISRFNLDDLLRDQGLSVRSTAKTVLRAVAGLGLFGSTLR